MKPALDLCVSTKKTITAGKNGIETCGVQPALCDPGGIVLILNLMAKQIHPSLLHSSFTVPLNVTKVALVLTWINPVWSRLCSEVWVKVALKRTAL